MIKNFNQRYCVLSSLCPKFCHGIKINLDCIDKKHAILFASVAIKTALKLATSLLLSSLISYLNSNLSQHLDVVCLLSSLRDAHKPRGHCGANVGTLALWVWGCLCHITPPPHLLREVVFGDILVPPALQI